MSEFLIIDGTSVVGVKDEYAKEIIIPYGITSISDNAFRRCYALETIELPNSIEIIGEYAFSKCSSLRIVKGLCGSLVRIGTGAFSECVNLEKISLKLTKLKTLERFTFRDCYKLKTIQCPSTLTKIEGSVFSECKELCYVSLNNGLEVIEDTFSGVKNLKCLWLPDSLIHIERLNNSYIKEFWLSSKLYEKFVYHFPRNAIINFKKKVEEMSIEFIKENLCRFQIEVLAGTFNKDPFSFLKIDMIFDKDDFGDEIILTVETNNGYFHYEPFYTCKIKNGEKYESHEENIFLNELVNNIKIWVMSDDKQIGLRYSSLQRFQECDYSELPNICDIRKRYDMEYLYVVSIGTHDSVRQGKMYKKQITLQEELLPFLQNGFWGIDDYWENGIFYKIFIENNIIPLKEYDDVFLKIVKKQELEGWGWHDEEEIRSVYNSNGEGIRCPNCNGFVKYSFEKKKYKCVLCGTQHTKKFLSAFYDTEIAYEEFPNIFM